MRESTMSVCEIKSERADVGCKKIKQLHGIRIEKTMKSVLGQQKVSTIARKYPCPWENAAHLIL